MLSRNELKYYSSLRQKKYRSEHKSFLAEGDKMVKDLLKNPGNIFRIKTLLFSEKFTQFPEGIEKEIDLIPLSDKELKRISSLSSPTNSILEIEIPEYSIPLSVIRYGYSLFLDNIQDPGNLGTIIRTADWFGIRTIFLSSGSVDLYNPKVIQSTMGSFSRVKIQYTDPVNFIESLKKLDEFQLLGAELKGEDIFKISLQKNGIIFLGNESKGLSKEVSELLDRKIKIPGQSGQSGAESLNLSVAAGIISSELFRRNLIQSGN
jgi:TrmH family RNA methyltransferase